MVLVNPPARHLGVDHVLLNGIARDYYVRDFPGPLSIKSVVKGTATWQTSEGRFDIGPGSCVVINDRQPYSITVESRTPVETLCLFFARGFVEDIYRASTAGDASLLSEPAGGLTVDFHERVRHNDARLTQLLGRLRGDDNTTVLAVGEALVRTRDE